MKKTFITALSILLLAVAGLFIANNPQKAAASQSRITLSYLNKNVATSSVTAIGPSASSSIIVETPWSDQVNLMIQDTGTVSTSTLNFTIQYSDDPITTGLNNCDTSSSTGSTFSYIKNCNWFTETISSSSQANGLIQESASTVHTWSPGTTATSGKMISIPNIGANYVRVLFGSTGTSSIWVAAGVKTQID